MSSSPDYVNYGWGTTIYGVNAPGRQNAGETVMVYPYGATANPNDPGSAAPYRNCVNDKAVANEPSYADSFQATGLQFGTSAADEMLGEFCAPEGSGTAAPMLSNEQCYFTSFPVGSKNCRTASCTVFNAPNVPEVTAATIARADCTTGNDGFLYFTNQGSQGSDVYATYMTGEIAEIYPASSFPTCAGGALVGGAPSTEGAYYATGLVVGAFPGDIQKFCTTVP